VSVMREIQQPGDVVYTFNDDEGAVRTFIVQTDGTLVEITIPEALRAEE
jgi:hypothetical protein